MNNHFGRRWFSTIISILLLAPLFAGALWGADFKAGFGRRQITPPLPILMAGFDARTEPAEAVANDLWTKGLPFKRYASPAATRRAAATRSLAPLPTGLLLPGLPSRRS